MYSNFQIHAMKKIPCVNYHSVLSGDSGFVSLELSFDETHFTVLLDNAEMVRELGRNITKAVPFTFVDPAMA